LGQSASPTHSQILNLTERDKRRVTVTLAECWVILDLGELPYLK
jgi:hypothetical protein